MKPMKLSTLLLLIAATTAHASRAQQPGCGNGNGASPYPCLPGMDAVGIGYDIVAGSSFGVGNRVVQLTYAPNATWKDPFGNDTWYAVPAEATITGKTSQFLGHHVFRSVSEYTSQQSSWVKEDIHAGFFSESAETSWASGLMEDGMHVVAVSKCLLSIYSATLQPGVLLTPDPYFQKFVDTLPDAYDWQAYTQLVQAYGTHYVSAAQFGGSALMKTVITQDYYSRYSDSDIEANLRVQWGLFGGGGGGGSSSKSFTSDWKSNAVSNTFLDGGDPAIRAFNSTFEWDAWARSVETGDPAVIHLAVEPIWALVRDSGKAANVQTAALNYTAVHGKSWPSADPSNYTLGAASPLPSPSSLPWGQFGHDARHTGRSPYLGPLGPHASAKWKYTTGYPVYSSPAVDADGTVYVGAGDKVYALNGTTGVLKWNYTTGSNVGSSPAIGADGTVYIGSVDSNVYALDGTTGALKWNYTTGYWVYSSPAIGADGTVYIGSEDQNVYALDGTTGALKWNYTTGYPVYSSPAVDADGTVYVGSRDHNVYALNGTTGVLKWKYTTGSDVSSSPAIGADGTVYIGSDDENVYALDGTTGALKWNYTTGNTVDASPAIGADGTVYIGSYDNNVYALDGTTGAVKWTYTTGSFVSSSPAIGADGTVYIGSTDNNVYALDGMTGALKWKYTTGGDVYTSSPTIGADGTVYVGSWDTNVYALHNV